MFDFKFDWDDSMKIGLQIIDEQHQELFRIARKMEQLIIIKCIGVERKELLDVVCELREFVTYHFYQEEEIMRSIDYTYYEQHKKQHDAYRKTVIAFPCDKLLKDPYPMMKELKESVQDWVFSHMFVEDVKMIPELKKSGLLAL